MNGVESIAAERNRQIENEGWTLEHDDTHDDRSIAMAAACYAIAAAASPKERVEIVSGDSLPEGIWPWAMRWWKPKTPREDLVRAGALIAAEIDRIDRAEQEQ